MDVSTADFELIEAAKAAAAKAYAPYSGYRVGSALRCADGRIFTGCNVENASYSLTICAERNAVFKAVGEGRTDFTEIAIYVESDMLFPPCGACRQVLYEFSPQMRVIFANRLQTQVNNLSELLPGAFVLDK